MAGGDTSSTGLIEDGLGRTAADGAIKTAADDGAELNPSNCSAAVTGRIGAA